MRRGADRGSIYYVIMSHPYPKLHKSPSNCCVSEIFPPKGDGPLPVVLQYWGNPWDRRSKLHSLSLLTKIGVMSGARSPIRDTTLVRTVSSYSQTQSCVCDRARTRQYCQVQLRSWAPQPKLVGVWGACEDGKCM